MASPRWVGKQLRQTQVNTITLGGTDGSGQTYSVTIGAKVVTWTSLGTGNVANSAGLLALLQACTEPEFLEVTWAALTTLIISATAKTPGYPFTQTSAAVTGTLVTATATANKSPSDIGDGANWSGGAIPATGDNVFIDNTSTPLLWNLSALAAVEPATVTLAQSFGPNAPGQGGQAPGNLSGTIGLPEVNTIGTPYEEYRPTYLQWAGASGIVKLGVGPGSGSGRVKMDFQSANATTVYVYNTGSPLDSGIEAFLLKGTNAGNVFIIDGGSVGIAVFGAETANVSGGLKIGAGGGVNSAPAPTVRLGAGVTWATITQDGGTLQTSSGGTTFTQYAGTWMHYAGAVTTINVGGTVYPLSTGTITNLNVWYGGTADFSQDTQARTVTNCTVFGNHTILDPASSVSWTNGIAPTAGVDAIANGTLLLGPGLTITP